jgi:hypothetical protein
MEQNVDPNAYKYILIVCNNKFESTDAVRHIFIGKERKLASQFYKSPYSTAGALLLTISLFYSS